MNYSKLDAALSSALSERQVDDETGQLIVSVRTEAPPDAAQRQELARLGVQGVGPADRVFSAKVSRRALAELSEMPWVRLVSLARPLEPLE
jgi:hypothetical protein